MSELPPISKDAAIRYLLDAARYFAARETDGEDSAFWSNVQNAATCKRIVELIDLNIRDD